MNIVIYSIGVSEPITPAEPLPPLPMIPKGALVVVEGRAPIWRYGMAQHLLHGSPAGAIAFYDPRLGAVVVASHSLGYREGQVLEIDLSASSQEGSLKEDLPKEEVSPGKRSISNSQGKASQPLELQILDWLASFRFTPFRLTFCFQQGTDYDISRLRGVWGRALKSLDEYLYTKVFEGADNTNRQTPRYIIRPAKPASGSSEPGSGEFRESIDFITWGTTAAERKSLLQAWEIASKFGLGRCRLPFVLESADLVLESSEQEPKIIQKEIISVATAVQARKYAPKTPCRLYFPVPLRLIAIQEGGKFRIESPTLPDLIHAAITRLNALREQMPSGNSRDIDNSRLLPDFYSEAIRQAEKTAALPWQGEQISLRRYSGRQKTEVDLAGTCGYLDLPNGMGELAPLLAAGEIFHVGKSTTLGLGRLIIQFFSNR